MVVLPVLPVAGIEVLPPGAGVPGVTVPPGVEVALLEMVFDAWGIKGTPDPVW